MLVRKCAACGEKIEVSLPYSKQYIYYKTKKKWYHIDCFTAITTPRIHLADIITNTGSFVLSEVSKDRICQLFYKHYNIDYISTRLFKKLDQIYNGTYKGLAQPIPPNELYDILKRKMEYLDLNAAKKGLAGEQRVNYDLAVAMGSYSSYKAWRTKVEAEQQERLEQMDKQSSHIKLRGYVPPPEPQKELIDYDETIE